MADDDKHKRGERKGKFCSIAAQGKCGCTFNLNYRDVCDSVKAASHPTWTGNYEFTQIGSGGTTYFKKYEAHHALCVSSVSKIILGKNSGILRVIRQTAWCV